MGVVLRNLQKVVPLRRARLRRDVDILRHILGIQKFDLGIVCVDNKRIRQINHIYRKKNLATDVLSFPFYEVNVTKGVVHSIITKKKKNLKTVLFSYGDFCMYIVFKFTRMMST